MANDAVSNKVDTFLNNAPIGKIFANRAKAVKVVPYMGAQYFDIDSKFGNALERVDVNKEQTPAQSWKQYVTDVKSLS